MNTAGIAILLFSLLSGAVWSFPRRTRPAGLILLAAATAALAFFIFQSFSWEKGFEAISLGATEQAVVTRMGRPPRVTDGTEWVEDGFEKVGSELVDGCVKEFWYHEFYAPSAFSFCFDVEGRLIDKYHWISW